MRVMAKVLIVALAFSVVPVAALEASDPDEGQSRLLECRYILPEYFQQSQENSCWVATLAMLTSWRDDRTHMPESISRMPQFQRLYQQDEGIRWEILDRVGAVMGLEAEPEINPTPLGWAEMLAEYGPILVGYGVLGFDEERRRVDFFGHAVIVTGIRIDQGEPGRVSIRIVDPANSADDFSSPDTDYGEWFAFSIFLQQYERLMRRVVDRGIRGHRFFQILHATDATISPSARQQIEACREALAPAFPIPDYLDQLQRTP